MHEFVMTISGWLMNYLAHSTMTLALLGLAAWACDRLLRKAGPQAQHRMWVAALVTGVALPLLPADLLASYIGHAEATGVGGTVTVTYHAIAAVAGRWTLPPLLGSIAAAVYLLTVLLSMTRLLSRWRRAWLMVRRASVAPPDALAHRLLEDAARRFEVAVPEVRCSTETRGPVVLGFGRAMLLVPEGFFKTEDDEDVRAQCDRDVAAALGHECAHIARWDFAKNLLYEFVAAAVAYHPACRLMRRRIAETRELVCDEMAAADDRAEYAASLLRLATGMAASGTPVSHAIGVFDADILEERIMRMTIDVPRVSKARKIALAAVAAGALLGGAVAAVAVPFDVGSQSKTQEKVYKVGGDVTPPVLTYAPDAEFPAAKKKGEKVGWSGVSIVELVVDNNGKPRDVHVTRSLAPDFDQSAMDAVRQYRFKPGMRKGEPVSVAITIEVNFHKY